VRSLIMSVFPCPAVNNQAFVDAAFRSSKRDDWLLHDLWDQRGDGLIRQSLSAHLLLERRSLGSDDAEQLIPASHNAIHRLPT
jgi:hypothetical protein